MSIGNNSKRPASISNISTYLEKSEKIEKFCVGPTSSKPGPILFNVAATAVKLVVKPKLSIPISNTDKKNITKYTAIYALVERLISFVTGRSSSFIFLTIRG